MKNRVHWSAATGLVALWILVAFPIPCAVSLAEVSPPGDSAAFKLYRRACGHVARGKLDLALELLRESFGSGHPHPMQVVSDSCFEALLLDPASRAALRSLLQRHAWDSHTQMITAHEPGERIHLQATVIDATTGETVPRALVELYQADSLGLYSRENDPQNPRLFAFLLSDDSGRVGVETIRPGSYSTSGGVAVPAHVHFSVSCPGYQPLSGEMVFSEASSIQGGESAPVALVCTPARADVPASTPLYLGRIALKPGR